MTESISDLADQALELIEKGKLLLKKESGSMEIVSPRHTTPASDRTRKVETDASC